MSPVQSPTQKFDPAKTKELARELRVDIIRMLEAAGSGHPGGSLSEAEILVTLFFDTMRHDHEPENHDGSELQGRHCDRETDVAPPIARAAMSRLMK